MIVKRSIFILFACATALAAADSSASGSNASEFEVSFCDGPRPCPAIAMIPPLCGSDGKTYYNECELKVAQCDDKDLVSLGPCPSGSGSKNDDASGSTGSMGDTPTNQVPAPTPSGAASVVTFAGSVVSLVFAVSTLL